MKTFIVYNSSGKILRTGICQDLLLKAQAGDNEFSIHGSANDRLQKIVDDRVVSKTAEEIESDNLPTSSISFDDRQASITNKHLQEIISRLYELESRL